jgi:trimethylamine---corrinoid protein Co-methyltransferase
MARRGRREKRTPGFEQLPRRQLRNPFSPMEILDATQLQRIHDASMVILEDIGLEFLDPDACREMQAAGANVDIKTGRVRMDRGLVAEAVAKAPSQFTLHARNPAHDMQIGGDFINFAFVSSPPNASDLTGGRRPGNFEDFCNLVRLAQTLNIVHGTGGYPVEPIDRPANSRHLDCVQAILTLTDKPFGAYALGHQRIADAIDMACIVYGKSRDELKLQCSLQTTINTNSPLRCDGPMLRGLKEAALWGQCVIVTPFTLAGAMSPVTLAGALAQQNAEALGVIAYQQIIAPGAPVIYGGFTSNVDMKSGAPAFGTPEYVKAVIAGGQLARRYGLPYRSSAVNASNAVDAQSAYETMMSLWAAVMSHANLIKHSAGWLEGGLCASFEKVILDAELLQGMAESLSGIEVNDETLALDAIREVGPGGHFFGAAHTMSRYETAFYTPMLSDWSNFEMWQEQGGVTTEKRAEGIFRQLLADFQPPPMDPAIAEELEAFVQRRKQEIKNTG